MDETRSSVQFFVLVVLSILLTTTLAHEDNDQECKVKGMAKFRLTIQGLWSKKRFPKHYPEYRPPAQFSKVIGEYKFKGWKAC